MVVDCSIGCGLCRDICPTDAIMLGYVNDNPQLIRIDKDLCVCCRECVDTCPVGILRLAFKDDCIIIANDYVGSWGSGGNGSTSTAISKIATQTNLNAAGLEILNETMEEMESECGYGSMYGYLVANDTKLSNIWINPSLTDGLAAYDPSTKEMYFRSNDYISSLFTEEFIHFFQDHYYPGGIDQYRKNAMVGFVNIEFEAKLIRDLICFRSGNGCFYWGAGLNISDDYLQWISKIGGNNEHFPSYSKLLQRSPEWGNYNYWDFLEDFKLNHPEYNKPTNPNLIPQVINFINNSGC